MKKQLPNTGINESGSITVIALCVLIVLTIIGVSAISRTGLELRIAGNEKQNKIAFGAAEAARGFVMARNDLYGDDNLDPGGTNFPNAADANERYVLSPNQTFRGNVEYISPTTTFLVPPGIGFSIGQYRAHRYSMQCFGFGPGGAVTNLEEGFFRIGL